VIAWIKQEYAYIHSTFHSSEVILWARAQYVLLAVYTALQQVDLSAIISDHRLLQFYIFANALVSEFLRRRNAEYHEDGSIK
jgi:hypothetical protein